MIMWEFLQHGDDVEGVHPAGSRILMLISMIAFSIFLLSMAWTLIRPKKQSERTEADVAIERYAHGEIGDDEFERVLRDIHTRNT